MFARVVLALLLFSAVAAHADDDPTLRKADQAFTLLRGADVGSPRQRVRTHQRARRLLSDVAGALEQRGRATLQSPLRDDLAEALQTDSRKPWRGLAHERVVVLATLAALDLEAGHPELAWPTLKTAQLELARPLLTATTTNAAQKQQAEHTTLSPLVVELLGLRTLRDLGGDTPGAPFHAEWQAQQQRVSDAYVAHRDQTLDPLPALTSAVLADDAVVALTGRAPTLVRTGVGGSQLVVQPAPVGPEGVDVVLIGLGSGARRRLQQLARADVVDVVDLWSSTGAANAIVGLGRPSDAQRQQKAAHQAQLQSTSQALYRQGATALQAGDARGDARSPQTMLGAGLSLLGSAGAAGVAATVDPRADVRSLTSAPEAIGLVVRRRR